MSIFHEQYESDDALVLFSCSECDYVSLSLGDLHAHVEYHWSTLGWFRWHLVGWLRSGSEKWMESTEIVRVQEVEEISLKEVEGL